MEVGDDPAVGVDDEARADSLGLLGRTLLRLHLRLAGLALLAEALGEALHELFHLLLLRAVSHLRFVVVHGAGLHGHGDIDDRRGHLGGEVGEILHGGLAGDRRGRSEQGNNEHRSRERGGERQGGENGLGLRHELSPSGGLGRRKYGT